MKDILKTVKLQLKESFIIELLFTKVWAEHFHLLDIFSLIHVLLLCVIKVEIILFDID